jgi:hypothetical protein
VAQAEKDLNNFVAKSKSVSNPPKGTMVTPKAVQDYAKNHPELKGNPKALVAAMKKDNYQFPKAQ